MNTDELIEQIHAINAERRNGERRTPRVRRLWPVAIPAAAAAVLLVVVLAHGNQAQAAAPAPGIYCNSQCSPDDVMALIDNNINHIKEIRMS